MIALTCKSKETKTTTRTTTCGQTKWDNQNTIETKLTSVFVNKSFAQGQTFFSSDTDAVAAGAAATVATTVKTVVKTKAAAPAAAPAATASASVSEEKIVWTLIIDFHIFCMLILHMGVAAELVKQ